MIISLSEHHTSTITATTTTTIIIIKIKIMIIEDVKKAHCRGSTHGQCEPVKQESSQVLGYVFCVSLFGFEFLRNLPTNACVEFLTFHIRPAHSTNKYLVFVICIVEVAKGNNL